jgi:hypothetical protein
MEFNLRIMADSQPRPPEDGYPYAPCDTINAAYAEACYFWLPQWVRASRELQSDAEVFPALGTYCGALVHGKNRAACFMGIGYAVPPAAEFKQQKAKQLCDGISSSQFDRNACWEEASKTIPSE